MFCSNLLPPIIYIWAILACALFSRQEMYKIRSLEKHFYVQLVQTKLFETLDLYCLLIIVFTTFYESAYFHYTNGRPKLVLYFSYQQPHTQIFLHQAGLKLWTHYLPI